MSYRIELTDNFLKEAKKLIKKYPSLKSELIKLQELLSENPTFGINLGNDIYKIRISISSKGKGKSGGARIMTFVVVKEETVYLFSIYNKGEKDSLSEKELKELLQKHFGN
jgi:mRNA-degrading endonuclease RelE of RelBE toxin-antitoxin system